MGAANDPDPVPAIDPDSVSIDVDPSTVPALRLDQLDELLSPLSPETMRNLLLRSGAVSVFALLRSPFVVPSMCLFTPSLPWDQVRFKPPPGDGRASVEKAGVAEADEAKDGLDADDMNDKVSIRRRSSLCSCCCRNSGVYRRIPAARRTCAVMQWRWR